VLLVVLRILDVARERGYRDGDGRADRRATSAEDTRPA
jgi:hypothetical protein